MIIKSFWADLASRYNLEIIYALTGRISLGRLDFFCLQGKELSTRESILMKSGCSRTADAVFHGTGGGQWRETRTVMILSPAQGQWPRLDQVRSFAQGSASL